jgi:hypothetical protein
MRPPRLASTTLLAGVMALLVSVASVPDARAEGARRREGAGARPLPVSRIGREPPSGRAGALDVWRRGRSRPVPGSPSPGPRAAVPVSGFDAISRLAPNWPADPTGAIGGSWILTAVNTSFALYDRSGLPVLGPSPLSGFYDFPGGTQLFDPKVVYDPYDDTFVLAFLAIDDGLRRSWIVVVAIPDATASDTTTWCASRIPGDRSKGDGRQWADYPGLGYDLDRVTLTTNRFDFDGGQSFAGAQILSFAKTGLYDCASPLDVRAFGGPATRAPDGTRAFTIQPATSVGTSPDAQYLLSYERTGKISAIVLWRVREGGRGLTLARTSIAVPRATISPYGTQGGGSVRDSNTWWDPGDLRLVSAFYDADLRRVYAAHVILRDLRPDPDVRTYAEAAIRWYEVSPARRLRASGLTRTGVVGTPETDAGWPAIGTDGAGDVFITYSRASAVTHEYLSAWVAEIAPGTRSAELTLLAPGQARFEAISNRRGSIERWGDYNAISRDPLDPSVVAVVNQYAKADGGPTTNVWQQTVHLVTGG